MKTVTDFFKFVRADELIPPGLVVLVLYFLWWLLFKPAKTAQPTPEQVSQAVNGTAPYSFTAPPVATYTVKGSDLPPFIFMSPPANAYGTSGSGVPQYTSQAQDNVSDPNAVPEQFAGKVTKDTLASLPLWTPSMTEAFAASGYKDPAKTDDKGCGCNDCTDPCASGNSKYVDGRGGCMVPNPTKYGKFAGEFSDQPNQVNSITWIS